MMAFLPLDEAITSRAVSVIVFGPEGQTERLVEPAKSLERELTVTHVRAIELTYHRRPPKPGESKGPPLSHFNYSARDRRICQ